MTRFLLKILQGTHWFLLAVLIITMSNCGAVDFYEELGNGCIYYGGDGDGIEIPPKYNRDIYGKVAEYYYDDNFITAKQHPDKEDYVRQLSFRIHSDSDSLNNYDEESDRIVSAKADSLIQFDPFYRKVFASKTNYWIVNHRKYQVLGPMNKKEFSTNFKSLGIDDDLMIKD